MEQKNDGDKVDEIMLPGFRFHPTDEELVAFYLKRKVQQRPLSIELIKQLDIYKYDPWDLPKLAATGEKEWYFYCPRDRKYRNSARPNRVTGAGFWKATGTDRPIYSSEGSKCIGLKKSLVFYKGRAAKGMKTDWMMHEFRLPSLADSTPPKRFMDKTIPANDAWAICRIFKKTNSTAQRALSQSWVSPVTPETILSPEHHAGLISCRQSNDQFTSSENISSLTTSHIDFLPNAYNTSLQHSPNNYYSPLDVPSYKSVYPTILQKPPQDHHHHHQQLSVSNHRILDLPLTTSFMFSPLEMFGGGHQTVKTSAAAAHHDDFVKASAEDSSIEFSCSQGLQCNSSNLSETLLPHHHPETTIPGSTRSEEDQIHGLMKNSNSNYADFLDDQWTPASVRANNVNGLLPFNLPLNLVWDSSPCPTEMSTTYSTTSTKCYTRLNTGFI